MANILIIESGGFGQDAQTEALNLGDSVGIPYPLTTTRTRQFGGSSNIWAGYCAPFDRHDFEVRAWVPLSGWPFSADELAPFEAKAAALLNVAEPVFSAREAAAGAGVAVPHELLGRASIWRFGAPTMRIDRAGLAPVVHKNLTILLNATVVEIMVDSTGSEARRLAVRTIDGREGIIEAKQIVVACGGIETARLLLNSDRQIAGGLGNHHDLVGRHFMEHPHQRIATINIEREHGLAGFVSRAASGRGDEIMFNLGLSADEQRDRKILNARAHIYRTPTMTDDEAPRLGLFAEQAPNPASRLRLTDRYDALGMRRIVLDWQLTELDWRTFEETGEVLAAALRSAKVGSRVHLQAVPRDQASILHSNHHLGTTRMAAEPALGVVDANARVHGMENLYLMGGGVFPTVSWANPTLTLMALSLRLAEHLKAKFAAFPSETGSDD